MGKMMSFLVIGALYFFGSWAGAMPLDPDANNGELSLQDEWSIYDSPTPDRSFSKSTPGLDARKYSFDIGFHPDQAQVDITESIDLATTADLAKIELDANSATMNIASVRLNGEPTTFALQGDVLTISIPQSLRAGRQWSIAITYTTGFSNPSFKLAYDAQKKAIEFATQTEPLGARNWYVSVDRPGDKAVYEATVRAPLGWKALSNGVLRDTAATPTDETARWEMLDPLSTYQFVVVLMKDPQITHSNWKGLPLSYWVRPENASKVLPILNQTGRMMDYFEHAFFAYPYQKYAVAAISNYGGAMEHTTAMTASLASVNTEAGTGIAIHELGHHWFGDLVTCATWDHLWLNEAFATFVSGDFLRQSSQVAAYLNSQDSTRKAFLTDDPKNGEAGPIVNFSNHPSVKFNKMTYHKGSTVLNFLRDILGDEAFFTGLRLYLKDPLNYMGVAETNTLQRYLEIASGTSLTAFFQRWIYRAGHPDLKIQVDTSGTITVNQTQPAGVGLFEFPLKVWIKRSTKAQPEEISLWVIQASEKFSFDPTDVEYVVPDPQGLVPGAIAVETPDSYARQIVTLNNVSPSRLTSAFKAIMASAQPLSYEEIKSLMAHSDLTNFKADLVTWVFANMKLDQPEIFDDFVPLMAESSGTIRKAVANALLQVQSPNAHIQKFRTVFDQAWQFTNDQKGFVSILANLGVANNIPGTGDHIRADIAGPAQYSADAYGNLLKALIDLEGDRAVNDYASNLTTNVYGHRGRTAWAMAFRKQDRDVAPIYQSLLVEHSLSDFANGNYQATVRKIDALDMIHTSSAKEALENFIAAKTTFYPAEIIEKAETLLAKW